MFAVYLPVFIMLGVATLVALGMFTATSLAGPKNMTAEKAIPYESGSETTGANHLRMSIKFYLTAILFVVFDIEAVFLYPWAVAFDSLGLFAVVEMILFMLAVFVAYAYVWRRGGLSWD